ncbi:MAG: hypothetical protein AB8H86_24780 [Polyangiales bacterium]
MKRRARRRANAPSLADAIFGVRWPRFLLRRAGFPVARALLSSFLHALEAAAMALLFDPEFLTPLVTARLTLSVSSGVLWAGTEGVRRDVRAALAVSDEGGAQHRLRQALRRGVIGAALILGAGACYVYASPYRPGYFTVVDAYILASALRIALSLPVRVMQAGAHAVRRVYRPFASFLVPDIIDGFSIFILWRWFGPWSVPLGMGMVGLLKLAITWRYTASTLGRLRLTGPGSHGPSPSHPRPSRSWGATMAWWVAGAAQTAPSWIVLGLWDEMGESEAMAATLWVLYAMRPIAALLPRLGGVFYVDLVRARRMGELAEKRMLRKLRRTLGIVGLCLGLVAGFASQDMSLGLALLGFYSVNGLFGLEAVRVIAFAAPWRSLLPALVAMLPASLIWLGADSSLVVGVASASFAVGFVLLRSVIPRPEKELDEGQAQPARGEAARPLSLMAWLSVDGREVTTLLRSIDSHRVARELAEDPRWRVTRLDRSHLLVFGTPPESWSAQTAGFAELAVSSAAHSPVDGVLELAQAQRALRPLAAQLSAPVRDAEQLMDELRAACDSLVVLTPKSGNLAGRECADSLREARRSAFVSSVRRGRNDAVALWEKGRMKLVVVVPRSADPAKRAAVREQLMTQSVARTGQGATHASSLS